jgi:hypothetical protein
MLIDLGWYLYHVLKRFKKNLSIYNGNNISKNINRHVFNLIYNENNIIKNISTHVSNLCFNYQ